MGTSLNKTMADFDRMHHNNIGFIELQIHDKLRQNTDIVKNIKPNPKFSGFFTMHGEGETDGKTKIKFSSNDTVLRKQYIKESIDLYSLVLRQIDQHRILRLILHPDTLSKQISRKDQIRLLASSLTEMADKLEDIEFVCIEPRGGNRQRKVLRANIEDLRILKEYLDSNGVNSIGLCIDVAQLFIVYGNAGAAQFLTDLKSILIPVKEFHISDVIQNKKVKNRLAMEVGTGAINWKLILPLILEHCDELLIETLGGVNIFQRSKAFLESLLVAKNIT